VGELISHAKQLGQAVNAARDHIIELKASAKKMKVRNVFFFFFFFLNFENVLVIDYTRFGVCSSMGFSHSVNGLIL
jgi:hypothetical protein